jgi:hypothetical protein
VVILLSERKNKCENEIIKILKKYGADHISDKHILKTGGLDAMGERNKAKAKYLYDQQLSTEVAQVRECREICSYAFAVSEQNADNGIIVTAPTCGSCGVLPAVLRYVQETRHLTDDQILRGLATAGIIGTLVKHNASISGAECGCHRRAVGLWRKFVCAHVADASAQRADGGARLDIPFLRGPNGVQTRQGHQVVVRLLPDGCGNGVV